MAMRTSAYRAGTGRRKKRRAPSCALPAVHLLRLSEQTRGLGRAELAHCRDQDVRGLMARHDEIVATIATDLTRMLEIIEADVPPEGQTDHRSRELDQVRVLRTADYQCPVIGRRPGSTRPLRDVGRREAARLPGKPSGRCAGYRDRRQHDDNGPPKCGNSLGWGSANAADGIGNCCIHP
jgi:hypothetical protein